MKKIKGTIYTRGKKGHYYLRYAVNHKETRVALVDNDDKPITRKDLAEQAAERILAPIKAKKQKDKLLNVMEALETADMKLQRLEAEQAAQKARHEKAEADRKALKIDEAWSCFIVPSHRLTPQCKPRALKEYGGFWQDFVRWVKNCDTPPTYMREITQEQVNSYWGDFEQGHSDKTFNEHLTFLKRFFEVLLPYSRCPSNPFATIERKKKCQPAKREAFTADELRLLLKEAAAQKGELGLLIWIGACTGLRLGDAATLEWNQIDFRKQIIKVTTQKTTTDVIVGIPPVLARILEEMPPEQRTGAVMPEISAAYKSLAKRPQLSRRIQRFFKQCGFETTVEIDGLDRMSTKYGFHSLRHSMATLLGDMGVGEKAVQQALGHSRSAMTEYYTHDTTKGANLVADSMDNLLTGLLPESTEQSEQTLPPTPREKLHLLIERLSDDAVMEILRKYAGLEEEAPTTAEESAEEIAEENLTNP